MESVTAYGDHLPEGALNFNQGSCGRNAVQFVAAFEALVSGTYKDWDARLLSSREAQAEHAWDETHGVRKAFSGWDLLALGP